MLAASTHDQEVFSFYSDERFCNGFEEVLGRYKELVPHLRLAGCSLPVCYVIFLCRCYFVLSILSLFIPGTGPTSFAPIIEMAITIVEQSGGQYHVLVIIADGQVLSSLFPLTSILLDVEVHVHNITYCLFPDVQKVSS